MPHFIDLGVGPAEEECAQLGRSPDFDRLNRIEIEAYRCALIARYGPPPPGCRLAGLSNRHDFGRYLTLVLHIEDELDEAVRIYGDAIEKGLATWIEAGFRAPVTYDAGYPTVERSDPSEIVIGALVVTRPHSDGSFPTGDFASLHANLAAAFPHEAAITRARLNEAAAGCGHRPSPEKAKSNSYLQTAFALIMSREDAALVREVERAVDLLGTLSADADLAAAYDGLGERFKAIFPPAGDSRFETFLEIFDDRDAAYFDADIDIEDDAAEGHVRVIFSGDQFGIDPVARLIFRACKSALPCSFSWSYDSDRPRIGEFGGGCVIITDAGIQWHNTRAIFEAAFDRIEKGPFGGADGFVLTTRHHEHGLSFWNNDRGFGPLATATVFTETEAAAFDRPIADDEPEFMALPAPGTAF